MACEHEGDMRRVRVGARATILSSFHGLRLPVHRLQSGALWARAGTNKVKKDGM